MSDDVPKDVPFPELPKGAGQIDNAAVKEFTETKSGLKYRILRQFGQLGWAQETKAEKKDPPKPAVKAPPMNVVPASATTDES